MDDGSEKACRKIYTNRERPSHLAQVLLSWRTPAQRRRIKETFRAIYGEEIVELLLKLKAANSNSKLCYGLWLWMMEPPERDAVVAKEAVDLAGGEGFNALVEIYVRRKSSHLFFSKQVYLAKFRHHLDKDILLVDADQPRHKILAALAACHRSHHDEVSQHIAKCDAKRFHEALKTSEGAIEGSSILEMFSKRSIPQLRLAFSIYKHIYGHDFIKALERRNIGEFEDSLRVVIKCMTEPYNYYAEMIHEGLMGMANKKGLLTRVMIASVEDGVNRVKEAFQTKYNMKLEKAIAESVADDKDFKIFLLALINTSGLDC